MISFSFVCCAYACPDISASSAVLIDADTLEVLYDKESEIRRTMASTTKIMTTLLAVESDNLDKTVKVKDDVYIEGTAIGFKKGDKLTLEALCYAMMLESGNDAAVLTARYLAGNEENFSTVMNSKAAEIGMNNTNFVTASGLDADGHYSTAYDMALLGAYSIKNAKFREICSKKNYKAIFLNSGSVRYFSNHNKLLSMCGGAIGVKTGFTKKSGRCLVSACERNGKLLVAVTLNAPDDWNDHIRLYDYGYSLYDEIALSSQIPEAVKIYGSEIKSIRPQLTGEIKVYALKNSSVETVIQLNHFLYAPIKKFDTIGKILYLQNGYKIAEQPIVSAETADAYEDYLIYKPSVFSRISDFIKRNKKRG